MRNTFFARLILANTFKKRIRALLVIGGIAVTTSVVIVLFGVSSGLHALVDDEITNSELKDVVTVDQRNVQQIKLNEEKVSAIQSISGVGQVESSVGLVGNLVYHGIDVNIPVYGVSEGYFALSPTNIKTGDATKLTGSDIILSSKVLEAFGLKADDAVGRPVEAGVTIASAYASGQKDASVTKDRETFTVAAVADKGELPVAYMPLESLRTKGVDSVSQVKLRVTTPDKLGAVRESVEQMGFQTTSIQDTIEQINKVFTIIQRALVAFGVVVFVITVSGAFTLISLTLMENTKQIGFLRISGMKNRDVHILFIVQSILLTALGAATGVVGGVLAGSAVNGIARASSAGEVFAGEVNVFTVPAPQIALVLVLSIGIGYLVGMFPAKRAVMLKPLEELKA